MGNKVDILIDGDPLVYRVGFSLERRTYYLTWRDVTESGDVEHIAFFHNAAARDEYIRLMNLHPDEYHSEMVPVPEENLGIVYGRVKNVIQDIQNQIGAYLYEDGREVRETRIFLSGSANYRNNLATIVPYKISRVDSPKPYHYHNIREYLVNRFNAEVTDGYEADDAVAIEQCRSDDADTVIATIDKDLKGVPGYHYNLGRKTMEFITSNDALLFFYRQVLTGDSTDDIPGCFKVGPAKAAKLLKPGMTQRDMWIVCKREYYDNLEQYPEHHGPYGEEFAAEKDEKRRRYIARTCATENARLLWMQREYDELWNEPGAKPGKVSNWLESHGGQDPDEDWL